jgi:hypothetical protein
MRQTPGIGLVALRDLPQSALDLIALIGLPATIQLVEAMPGIKFPVPKGEDNNSGGAARFATLVEAVGDKAAHVLVAHFGGDDLYVPSCKKAIQLARDRQIVAEYLDGSTVTELAIRYRLSYRRIEVILKTTDTTPVATHQQADLFA